MAQQPSCLQLGVSSGSRNIMNVCHYQFEISRYEGELFSVPTPRYGLAARILEQLTGQNCER